MIDRSGQGRLRQIGQQRRQEQGRQSNADSRIGTGRRRFGPGIKVHHRAGKPAGHRIAAGDGRGNVGGAKADQLLIRHDPLPLLGRKRLRHRHRFHETDHRDQQRRAGEIQPELRIEGRQGRHRQPGRDVADKLHAKVAE